MRQIAPAAIAVIHAGNPATQAAPMSTTSADDGGTKRCRYACTFCSEKKIKCDGLQPCSQCRKRHKECVYMTKKKPSAKLRRTDAFLQQQQPQPLFAPELAAAEQQVVQHWPGVQGADPLLASARLLPRQSVLAMAPVLDASLQPVSLAETEKRYLQQYMRLVNAFVPLLPSSMIRDAMNPVSFDALGVIAQQLDQVKQAACKAATWAAVSMGASISHDPSAETFVRTAVSNLRECFDHPCREAFCAYLVVAEAYCMLGDRQSFVRYVSFADLIRRELTEELGLESEVAMNHIRAQCYSLTKGGKRFGKFTFPDFSQLAKYPTNLYAVSVVDFVLVSSLDLMDNTTTDAMTTRRSFAHFVTLLEPLKARLDFEGARQSNPIALLVCFCMLGLSLAKVERLEEGFALFRAVVDLAEAAPYLVCLPLTWHSMSVLHRYFAAVGENDLARRLEAVLRPNANKWTNHDDLRNLPLTNGVFNQNSRDMKDMVIRDLIETFARNSTMGGAPAGNSQQQSQQQQQQQSQSQSQREQDQRQQQQQQQQQQQPTDSAPEAKDVRLDGFGARQQPGSSTHGRPRSSIEGSFAGLRPFSPPQELPQQAANLRGSATTPVQLMRGLSDTSNISFAYDCFGDFIDDVQFNPSIFQDGSLPGASDSYASLNEMGTLSSK